MSTPMAPAGWYDDGQHPGQQRYWDGAHWTEHFHPPIVTQASTPSAPRPARSGRYWAWLAPVLVVVIAGGTVLGLALGGVFGGNDSPANAISQLIAGTNERDCDKILSATTVQLGESMSSFYCGSVDEDSEAETVAFQPTQTFATQRGATVLGILVQTGPDSTNSNCYAITTVIEQGRWRVDTVGSDSERFPSDVELDSTAPGYCTGTPGLSE